MFDTRDLKAGAVAFLLGLTAVLIVGFSTAQGQEPRIVDGAAWDDSRWSGIVLPDSCSILRLRADSTFGVFPLPKGTVMLLPVPKSYD